MDYNKRYNLWMNSNSIDEKDKEHLRDIKDNDKKERFYKELEFGTGGLRGVMGNGSNRINKYTVRKVTEGLSRYLIKKYTKDISVAIAYDSRNNSSDFANEAAKVLAGNNIKVYLYDDITATPILSYTVRKLNCNAGIVITASHNSKEYNGYKVYNEYGVQITDKMSKEILSEIRNVKSFDEIKYENITYALEKEHIVYIGKDIKKQYIEKVKSISLRKNIIDEYGDKLKIIYTPIHGTGREPITRILEDFNYKFKIVKEQENADGNFPTVKYPNPEDTKVFKLALEMAKKEDVDLIIGTDPDCDRVGVVCNDNGKYIPLTGNEIGILLSFYALEALKSKNKLSKKAMIIKTIVTTDLVKRFEEEFEIDVLEVLTGFKYIGELVKNENSRQFILGFEESYGYLTGDFVGDKDAVIATSLICEMALYYKLKGISLCEQLKNIYRKYGYSKEKLLSFEFKGIDGKDKIDYIMNYFRSEFFNMLENQNIKVKKIEDYKLGIVSDLNLNEKYELTLPKSNVVKFILEDNSWIVIRPSGTEPKLKVYLEAEDKTEEKCINKINDFEKIIRKIIL